MFILSQLWRIPHAQEKKKHSTIKHKGINLRKCSVIYRFMQIRLHMRSVHLLTCTCLRLQTDQLHTHERGAGERLGGEGGRRECSPLLSTRHTEEPQPGDACCSLPPAAKVQQSAGNHWSVLPPHRTIEEARLLINHMGPEQMVTPAPTLYLAARLILTSY